MTKKETIEIWKKVSAIIADEILTNEEFSQKMSGIFYNDTSVVEKRKNRRSPAKIDPFALLERGEDNLFMALADLSIDELKDVISANGMDTAKLAMKWKDRKRLENHIIDATKRKSSRGEAFWNSQGES